MNLRKDAIMKIVDASLDAPFTAQHPEKDFGINVFTTEVMKEKLPKDIFKKFTKTLTTGEPLTTDTASAIAHAMKEWAIGKGVTHFTHWFQPLTGLTAEKHDAFLEVEKDGSMIERFKADQLVQSEPDASSFPSGGRRTTFEARGYTAWDPSSPAFIMDGPQGGILCIPSIFISYNGEALDKKTPLLRSDEAINKAATRVIKLISNKEVSRVMSTIGTEQEYFLVDKKFYSLRQDLQITGRTLCGATPPKGQQLDDHYFGSIKERVLDYMQEVEKELYKLGIPAKTRHNEVAPAQYEIAPIYAEANVGSDRNQLTMEVLKKVSARKGLAMMLHEKPFAGINGSGKHNNWSLEDSDGNNLLDPGDTPEENLQFLVFLVATVRAVHQYGSLLRASVASAGNDHRLGANEAPPAIMSVFLGEMLSNILDAIKEGKKHESTKDFVLDLGVSKLPSIIRHNTDRNRTSPFAFTGSKFEFRAVGSADSVSFANTVINGAVSESLDIIADEIEELITAGKALEEATLEILQKHVIETEAIRFEGNNYSAEWKEEAARRGLPILNRTGYALSALISPKNKKMFLEQKIFTGDELESHHITKLEKYVTSLEIEVQTFIEMIETNIVPAALAYQNEIITSIKGLKDLPEIIDDDIISVESEMLKSVNTKIVSIKKYLKELSVALEEIEGIDDLQAQAKYVSDSVVDLLEDARIPVDELETIIPDELWPLPKYSEMLFIL